MFEYYTLDFIVLQVLSLPTFSSRVGNISYPIHRELTVHHFLSYLCFLFPPSSLLLTEQSSVVIFILSVAWPLAEMVAKSSIFIVRRRSLCLLMCMTRKRTICFVE